MVSGFLVRADGALVAIDHILHIAKTERNDGVLPRQWDIIIFLVGGLKVTWNQDPLMEKSAEEELLELRKMIESAMEL